MFFSKIKKSASSKLGMKSIIAVILLISIISITLTTYFVIRQKNSYTVELQKRAFSLSSNLAYNSQMSVLSRDIETLQMLLPGLKKESDIEEAFITDLNGVILAHHDTLKIGQNILISANTDSLGQGIWIPTDYSNIWRTITPIVIERKTTESDEALLFSALDNSNNTVRELLGYAVLDVSLESMNRDLSSATRHAIAITIVMIFFGALGIVYMVKSVANPIQFLAKVTREVAQGNLNQDVPINRSDEIGILANSFTHMIHELKISREKIEGWNRELEMKVTERTSELEEKHKELAKAYEELKTLDKAKDDFLSLVSHELRTPLSSILLYSEMLFDGLADSEEDRNQFLTTVIDSCKRLTRLINDVLDLSKIEAGRMPFIIDDLHIKLLISETLSSIRPKLESKSLDFNYDQVENDIHLWGDRDKIIQVLTNITSNAIKFTPEGGSISISADDYNKKMGIIAIKDTGKGIKKEDIPKVFDRFSQLENIDHHSEGTGLGMTISKSIIEKLGGDIWLESEHGKGTTVFFTLPNTKQKITQVSERHAVSGIK